MGTRVSVREIERVRVNICLRVPVSKNCIFRAPSEDKLRGKMLHGLSCILR